jgi:hypothetical protein
MLHQTRFCVSNRLTPIALGVRLLSLVVFLVPPAMTAQPDAGVRETPRRPNIVFILADDLGYGELGCYGQEKIKTPRLDSMAAEGMRFTCHYAGFTVCSPSRCALMTGKHMGHASVKGNGGRLRKEDVTVARCSKYFQLAKEKLPSVTTSSGDQE